MTLTFYKALTSEKIVKAENVWDFAIRDDHYGNWILDITYYDDGIEQDINDSMILCEASDEHPWTDLIMIKEDDELIEIRASEEAIKNCKTKLNSLYGKSVHEMI
ncbi:hypothetical protein [Ruminococcus sp.]|uniref:hypothetical protein n=1 Tax=Ruminococcus sp. TaxID=41978 RepID=UPI001B6BA656|nr:hypothetical protein [Ruminococcus sp.]MBP5433401.1 hypothetical protein [Ruminococcus sp.]